MDRMNPAMSTPDFYKELNISEKESYKGLHRVVNKIWRVADVEYNKNKKKNLWLK